jgi:hypothetical protein
MKVEKAWLNKERGKLIKGCLLFPLNVTKWKIEITRCAERGALLKGAF